MVTLVRVAIKLLRVRSFNSLSMYLFKVLYIFYFPRNLLLAPILPPTKPPANKPSHKRRNVTVCQLTNAPTNALTHLERHRQHTSTPPNRAMRRRADVQWRVLALSRGLGLPMPRPYRAPYMPGITGITRMAHHYTYLFNI